MQESNAVVVGAIAQNIEQVKRLALYQTLSVVYQNLNEHHAALEALLAAAELSNFDIVMIRPIMPVLGRMLSKGSLTVKDAVAQLTQVLTNAGVNSRHGSNQLGHAERLELIRAVAKAAIYDNRAPQITRGVENFHCLIDIPAALRGIAVLDHFGDLGEEAMVLRQGGWKMALQKWQRQDIVSALNTIRSLNESLQQRPDENDLLKCFLKNAAAFDRNRAAYDIGALSGPAVAVPVGGIVASFVWLMEGAPALEMGVTFGLIGAIVALPAVSLGAHIAWHLWTPWGGATA